MSEHRPLLTIAIPTFNRAVFLQELLELLVPQLENVADIELIVCNNASTDSTTEVVDAYLPAGDQRFRRIVNESNIGSDANFVKCFREARGKYFWLFGDDDIIRPGAIACIMGHLRSGEYDLVYFEPHGFLQDWREEFAPVSDGRTFQVFRSGRSMALIMGTMVAFITATLVNRDRALQVIEEQPEDFIGTALVHLSWLFPLLANHRQSLCLWERWVTGRSMNSMFNVVEIFGRRFGQIARRLLRRRPQLARIFINGTLRGWFPSMILEMRAYQLKNDNYGLSETEIGMKQLFWKNPRFWLFVYPALKLPLPIASRVLAAQQRLEVVTTTILRPGKLVTKIQRMVRQRRANASR
ncbi:glycosyltransferase family 2 protein [Terriglobus roseus]|uniref:Glycosyl transferase family 2 n=1 Tax=Terriglobus roseus TaxID=392734 RepID=A0A1H4RV03_9BACT|nr:glycosyltransferase family 2 protein [Terriglobus roseus]SEC35730.1 Glycosyl transferase family 2 [Terriglobus roseus]